jgi:low temperature requirement protein LtrA
MSHETPAPPSPLRHLRARGEEEPQPTTKVELLFDLVYVFAITQLSHLILDDLSVAALAQATFLLVVVWWAWIYTTWMANWFDPASPPVRMVLTGVMLASLLMAAALPEAFGGDAVLFAASYVALQVGRNAAAMTLLARDHRLRDVFERLLFWSVVSGALWLAGATLESDQRLLLWMPALALELVAPVARYWLPGRGRAATTDWDVEGGHFAERCQLFIIIAFGESIVVTGAAATDAGLTSTVVACLAVAFLETVALWWLYFGTPAGRSHAAMSTSDDPGRVARDAYTYLHLLIVAGIIGTAAADGLLIAGPHDPQHGVGTAVVLGGPALFLLGESLFQWRTVGTASPKRLAAAALIIALAPLSPELSTLALTGMVTGLLAAVAIWEVRAGTPTGGSRQFPAQRAMSRSYS